MKKRSKPVVLKSKRKLLLLRSIAQCLERRGFSQCSTKLISAAEIKMHELNNSLPDLGDIYREFLRDQAEDEFVEEDDQQKLLLICSIARYLELCDFSECYTALLSEAKITENDLISTTSPDLEQIYLKFMRKKKHVSKKRKLSESSEDPSPEESKEIMTSFNDISQLLIPSKAGLDLLQKNANITLPNLKMAHLLSSWNYTEVLYSWNTMKPDIIPEPYRQVYDDCWAVALSRGQNTAVSLSGFFRHTLNPTKLRDGMSRAHQNENRGLEDLEYARSFMAGKYIDDMNVYRRPAEDYEDFEDLIESLLVKGPMVVSYDILPSYGSYDGKSVYIPTDMECDARAYETFERHSVLLTGCGIQLQDGEFVEFWETLDSQGIDWGRAGFGRLARRKGMI